MRFSYESKAWDDCAAGLLVSESGVDWSCFATKRNLRIQPDLQTSRTYVTLAFKSQSEEAVDLCRKAIGTRDNCDYRLIEKLIRMTIVAMMPARYGSKRLPRKN